MPTFHTEQLNNIPIANTVKTFLTENGLPQSSRKESTLGIHFITDVTQMTPVLVDKHSYWKIGNEWEENKNIIAIREGTEEVYAVELGQPNKAVFINSNLPSFLLVLQYFKQYEKRKEAWEPPPMILSRDEMLKKLEMFKNGTMPVADRAGKKEAFDQQNEFNAMKSYIQQCDAVAIQNENYWWHIILEQVANDIL
ncbi:SUKH-4 family immunity protein [Niastella sp. OAS944]|uniref:SUKH-4 family immunity protein n=1 Tax=Niastella sp. OAS944 TaxID=2664089 RepID=UPI00346E6654|nr:hypothetical protein [Chitinophagaceae bacterium OAS944]